MVHLGRIVLLCAGVMAYVVVFVAYEPWDATVNLALWVVVGAALGFGTGRGWSVLATFALFIPPLLWGWQMDDGEYINEWAGWTILYAPISVLSIGTGWLLREGLRAFASRAARPSR